MGVRHAMGAAQAATISEICMVDISEDALLSAKQQLDNSQNSGKFQYLLLADFKTTNEKFDVCIIASTASGRKETVDLAYQKGCKHLMVEKPLGQSMQEASDLSEHIESLAINTCVNLNMRLYDSFIQLRKDLNEKPQLKGEKVIMTNTGTIGIGANGIHYLDLLYFLLDAESAELVAGEIEETLIPSGRGPQFGDFGGWCTIKLFGKNGDYKGRAHLSMAATSTAFGGWDIVTPHGRITLHEIEQKRIDYLRKEDSQMPISRYAADYLPPVETKIESPFLGDLTKIWLEELAEGRQLLPSVSESLKVHQLMFDWLSKSTTHKETFPIT